MKLLLSHSTKQEIEKFMSGSSHALIISSIAIDGMADYFTDDIASDVQDIICTVLQPDGSSISIDQIRALKQSLSLKQIGKQQRIVILENAQLMTPEAQNSFLKVLEEPPNGIKVIMLTTAISDLLTTIQSRSSIIRSTPVGISESMDHYTAFGITDDDIKRSYAISDGQPNKLFSLLSDKESDYHRAIDEAKQIIKDDMYHRLLKVDALSKDKAYATILLSALHDVLRTVSRSAANQGAPNVNLLAEKRKTLLESKKSLRGNANVKLVLTDVLLNI